MVTGAFLAGAITPKVVIIRVGEEIERAADALVVPFFILPGLILGVEINAHMLALGTAYIVCAGGAKFLGVYGAARLAGCPNDRSLVIGFLLNTRGTVELVVATALFNAGLFH